MQSRYRLIAHYLPQYHPIPENVRWWGKGFTEWTNVARAVPLFEGHIQPKIPADLGFYDLRLPEARQAQAELAREYGIEGFCYWHYWFAGKQLLERPFQEVLKSGEPDFPFCLGWANETWSGIWHGKPNDVLISQTYPGDEDHRLHFNHLVEAFRDHRYMCIDGKPIFVIYKPQSLPDTNSFINTWQTLAVENGLPGIHFLGISEKQWDYQAAGFDGAIIDTFRENIVALRTTDLSGNFGLRYRIIKKIKSMVSKLFSNTPQAVEVYSYSDFIKLGLPDLDPGKDQYPVVVPNWDNTPRSGFKGVVLQGSNPVLFGKHFQEALDLVDGKPQDKRIIFIKSWNEWAEGNYLEPDQENGRGYLETIKQSLDGRIKERPIKI